MEDPDELLAAVLRFADARPGIEAVVQTGSRARDARVDAFSDLDVELIGPAAPSLAGDDAWAAEIAPVLVSIQLANDDGDPDAPGWPSCLVVFARGRKVDFTLAGPGRLTRLAHDGLDATFGRGYVVLRDRAGLTAGLAPSRPAPPPWTPPTAEAFTSDQRVFFFEATQVPVYAARGDLWPALTRLADVRRHLLAMLEWRAGARSAGATDTWHLGHHLSEWLPAADRARLPELFAGYDADAIVGALRAAVDLYAAAAAEAGAALSLPVLDLRERVLARIAAVTGAERG